MRTRVFQWGRLYIIWLGLSTSEMTGGWYIRSPRGYPLEDLVVWEACLGRLYLAWRT